MISELDDILDPNRIVLYKCSKGHVTGIRLKDAEEKKCPECERNDIFDVIMEDVRKLMPE